MSIRLSEKALHACSRLRINDDFGLLIKEMNEVLNKKREESDYPSDEKSMWINAGYRQALREFIEAYGSAGDAIKRIKENQITGI